MHLSMFKLPVDLSSGGVTIPSNCWPHPSLSWWRTRMVPFQTFLVWKEGSQKFIVIWVNSYTLNWNSQTWEWLILSWCPPHSWEFLLFTLYIYVFYDLKIWLMYILLWIGEYIYNHLVGKISALSCKNTLRIILG